MNTSSPLTITNLSKSFKEKTVLRSIDLTVESGEIFGLIGLNGVGKTTLIKTMLNLLYPNEGHIAFFGMDHHIPKSRHTIAYLPEKLHPSPFLKGTEFLDINLSFYKRALDIDEATSLAEQLDLNPQALHERIGKYSKGMAQKLGLISVFLSKAPFLVLDEPMSGLDPSARIYLKALLLQYKKNGNTIFFSSHILADIEEICDRIGVIHGGDMSFIGTPAAFLRTQKETHLEKAFLKSIKISSINE